ncbi:MULTISPECIES: DMT family transporter [Polymorphospora]|uniref:DMT family transporter n=1 Tax=Polymorphospora lycopeni TaxID=3140240 RepID=A0ABV5CTR4_9ACTN
MKALPGWAALGLATVGGVASAAQSATNAELGARMGNAALGAVVNNAVGTAVLLVGLLVMPSMRSGLRALRRSGLPWWAYLGGLGGAFFVTAATYAVPVLGVALFTIAQVTGNSFGGLAVDRGGLAPGGRLALTWPRVAGALLGIGAVALAQVGRPYGDLALAGVALAVAGGLAVALQSALNARLSAASTNAAGTAVNFAVSTPAVVAAAVALGIVPHLSGPWPTDWYLYVGGVLAVIIVVILLLSVRSVGVLRTGLAIVGGQLGGALLLDLIVPGGPGASLAVLAGALLTVVAVVVSGRVVRPAPAGS